MPCPSGCSGLKVQTRTQMEYNCFSVIRGVRGVACIPLSLDEAIKLMIIYMIIYIDRYMHLDIFYIHILYYPSAV